MIFKPIKLFIASEDKMLALGKHLADVSDPGSIIYLHGELGTGKTTLARGFLRAFGHEGAVKSPTYTLVEHYELKKQQLYHFDLYRLTDPEELEFMGARDYFQPNTICLVEWAENGEGFLPPTDLFVRIKYEDAGQRGVHFESGTPAGYQMLKNLFASTQGLFDNGKSGE